MTARTMSEKILSRVAGKPVSAGDIVVCTPDLVMATDGSFPMAIDYLTQMEPDTLQPRCAEKVILALDHYDQSSGPRALALQERGRAYALEHGLTLYEAGMGVGHQLILESGRLRPGMLALGADSHSTTYGALNCFATGIGSSDLAGILLCDAVWLRVPESVRIEVSGALAPEVVGKDVALWLARYFEGGGANYLTFEFHGDGLARLPMKDRIVIANMAVECGAKAAIFPFDAYTEHWAPGGGAQAVQADVGARYCATVDLDLKTVSPQVARPHRVDDVRPLGQGGEIRVDAVYIGTCTAGRYEDFLEAFRVIEAHTGIAPGMRLILTPASLAVQERLEAEGILARFVSYGAVLQPPGCGSCCGTAGYRPADGEVVVSTANRNFQGRMGNARAFIYLASPASCALAACTGSIAAGAAGS